MQSRNLDNAPTYPWSCLVATCPEYHGRKRAEEIRCIINNTFETSIQQKTLKLASLAIRQALASPLSHHMLKHGLPQSRPKR